MAMTKKLGATLQTGVTASGISGVHEQTGSHSPGGELQPFYDKDGNEVSVYLFDDHLEYRWTAIMESSVVDKKKGDPITVGTSTCYVLEWEVTEANNDVKRVNITARTTTLTAQAAQSTQSASSNSQTPANGNT
jgi:hypothetical protein